MGDASDIPPQDSGRKPGWSRVVLFLSLAMNLLIVGLVAGYLIRSEIGPPPVQGAKPAPLRDLGYGAFSRALDRQGQRRLIDAIKQHEEALKANRRDLRTLTRAFLEALRAEPYDHERTGAIAARIQARLSERQELGQRLLLEQIRRMSSDDRRKYANRLGRLLRLDRVRD